MRNYISDIALPSVILLSILAISALSSYDVIPKQEKILEIVLKFIESGGYAAIFLISLIENTAILNVYFPGAIAILAAMALTQNNPPLAMQVWTAITLGACAGQMLSFWLGRKNRKKSDIFYKNLLIYFCFISYVHPYLGSISSYNLGRSNIKFHLFSTFISIYIILWNIFWGLLVYNFGNFLGNGEFVIWFIFCISSFWIIYRTFYLIKSKYSNRLRK